MALSFAYILIFVGGGLALLHFYIRLNELKSASPDLKLFSFDQESSNPYRPMLRLLSRADEEMVASNKTLAKKLKKQRAELFRTYLNCLSADYGKLLAGIRQAMADSGTDRQDLAAALAKNRKLFALALCRIEYRLFLYRFGLGSVDVSGLVNAMSAMRAHVSVLAPTMDAA